LGFLSYNPLLEKVEQKAPKERLNPHLRKVEPKATESGPNLPKQVTKSYTFEIINQRKAFLLFQK
jgi:hypothetical protein